MKISIALCTYNGQQFIEEQLDSILLQTVRPYELVVCDDDSKDGTVELLNSFKKKCTFPVRIYENEVNVGSTINFENAIQRCTGDVIVLCDQDDVWKPIKLETIETAFEHRPEIGYVFSDAEIVDENLNFLGRTLWDSFGFYGDFAEMFAKGEQMRCFLRKQQFITGATIAFRASLKDLILPVPAGTIWIHDGWLVVMAAALGVLGLPLPEKLVLYRQHSAQQSGVPLNVKPTLSERYVSFKHDKQKRGEEWWSFALSYCYLEKRLEDLPNRNSQRSNTMRLIAMARKHLSGRAEIQTARIPRKLFLVLREILMGRYRLFGNPFKSIITDLIV